MGRYPEGQDLDDVEEVEPTVGDRLRTGVERHDRCRARWSEDFEELCALILPLFTVSSAGLCPCPARTYVMM